MTKRKVEITVPDNLEKLIDSLAKFLHRDPDDLLGRIASEAVKTLPDSLEKYIDAATIRKIYNV